MPMLVMSIWKVRVNMCQRIVPVNMPMLTACRHYKIVFMLVMFVVNMLVIVHQLVMNVLVFMVLSQV